MNVDLADFVAAAYLVWGIFKGRRRGLSVELPRLVSVLLAFVTGAGIFRWAQHTLSQINKLGGQIIGAAGWAACLACSFYIVRWFRSWAGQRLLERYSDDKIQKRGGMVAGLFRTFFISSMIVLFLLHTPLDFVVRDALITRRLIRVVQPVYHVGDSAPK